MKNTILIKVVGILVIAAFVWWGTVGHNMTSNASSYWFHETAPQTNEQGNAYGSGCAPAYPFIALGLIVIPWAIIISMQGGIKYYGNWKRDRWILGGLLLPLFGIILAKIILG